MREVGAGRECARGAEAAGQTQAVAGMSAVTGMDAVTDMRGVPCDRLARAAREAGIDTWPIDEGSLLSPRAYCE